MTAPTRAVAHTTATAQELNQLIDLLEGGASMTEAFKLVSSTGENFIIKLSDAAGARKLSIQDSAGVEVASIDSDGGASFASLTPTGALTIPTATSPSQTADGAVVWDSDDNHLTIGTGAATKRVTPVVAAGFAPAVAGEFGYDTTLKALKVHDGTSSFTLGQVKKYVAATQATGASTSFVDVIAAGSPATMSFEIGASEVWHARYRLRLIFTGTGGAKFQFTGPAAPTAVRVSGFAANQANVFGSGDAVDDTPVVLAHVSAFSSSFGAADAAATTLNLKKYNTTDEGGWVDIDLFVVNGANAGTVTLQFAQNSANSDTVMQIGSWMKAERFA